MPEDSTSKCPGHGNKWLPVLYATYFGLFKASAEKHGYALALHGSFVRDMDLILVPLTDTAEDPEIILEEWFGIVGYTRPDGSKAWSTTPSNKPHGRISYTLATGAGGYVDVSVMPRKT